MQSTAFKPRKDNRSVNCDAFQRLKHHCDESEGMRLVVFCGATSFKPLFQDLAYDWGLRVSWCYMVGTSVIIARRPGVAVGTCPSRACHPTVGSDV